MNYEQKYKFAIEQAKKELDACDFMNCDAARQIFRLFPELAESKDERIKKEIIRYLDRKIISSDFGGDIATFKGWIDWIKKQGEPQDKGEISDGYHTFNELYYYRMLYNAAFFNMLPKEWVHKSKKHNDGEECFGGGWFIVMANLPTGQISNHYELKDWDLFQIPEKEVADKWDGHTPQEAADRLHKYLCEKQGEQLNKIKPKFKVGDWVVYSFTDQIYQVNQIVEAKQLDDETWGYTLEDGSYFSGSWENSYRLWTIQDAKKGDILQANKCTLIFDSLAKDIDGNTAISSWYYCDTKTFYGMGTCKPDLWVVDGVVPATKEQCNLLFQKMEKAGYEWDAEKKELKKIEQKPIKWSEEDETTLACLTGTLNWAANNNYHCPEYIPKYMRWLENLKQRLNGTE